MSSPLRRRLTLLTAVTILPITLLAAGGLYFLVRYQDEQAQRVGVELARSVANAVTTELRGSITILQTLATAPALDQNDVIAFRQRATRIVGVQHSWAAIVLADSAGTATLDTRVGQGEEPLPIIDRESMDRVISTREPTVGVLVNHQGEWLFPVRVPVMRDGQLQHIITALVRPSAIVDVILRQQVPDNWVISILDQSGVRVARSQAQEANVGGRLSESGQKVIVRGGDEGSGVSTNLEGIEFFTPFSSVQPFGWKAAIGIPTADMHEGAIRSAIALGGGVLLSILLGTLGAGWVASGITGPINQLRDAANAVGRREVPRLPPSDVVELDAVGIALTRTATELARYEAEREDLLQKERAAREAAERADRAKDQFLAVLSHELRTPLNAVFGWARLLQSNQMTDEAHIARAKDAIVRNADAQVRLIDDLLDLSRISSGKMRLNMVAVDTAEICRSAVEAIRPSADDKGVRITASADDEAATVMGDAARLQQIIWNLLANAVKFTASGGEVSIGQRRTEEGVEIVVRDTGQGIAPELLPFVFDRFRQGDSSSTRTYGGLGLGLALVRDLVDLHGGTVTAASEGVGCGSTFTVRLPGVRAIASPSPAAPAELATDALLKITRLDGLRVLVADDDADALTLTQTILANAGAEVRTASTAARAFDSIVDHRPHLLVSDLEMPDQDGYELIRRIRARTADEGGKIPAIALSAYGRSQDRTRALAAGFNMHVPKPVDPGELTAIVAALAGHVDGTPGPAGYGKMPISI